MNVNYESWIKEGTESSYWNPSNTELDKWLVEQREKTKIELEKMELEQAKLIYAKIHSSMQFHIKNKGLKVISSKTDQLLHVGSSIINTLVRV